MNKIPAKFRSLSRTMFVQGHYVLGASLSPRCPFFVRQIHVDDGVNRFVGRAEDDRKKSASNPKSGFFIHISPSGDFWTGEGVFAAKHLSSNYLRSIPIPNKVDVYTIEQKLNELEPEKIQEIYDSGTLPPDCCS